MFLSKNIIYKLNGFNEIYEMYYEDVDFCLRAKKENINCHYLSEIVIYHLVSYSIGGRYGLRKYYSKLKSLIKFLYMNNNIFLFLFYIVSNIFLFPFAVILFLNRKFIWKK